MLTDDDWLEKFIDDYKKKLAEEKRELSSTPVKMTAEGQQVGSGFTTGKFFIWHKESQEKGKKYVPSDQFCYVHYTGMTCIK